MLQSTVLFPEHFPITSRTYRVSIKVTVMLGFFLLSIAIYHTSNSLKCFSKYACDKEGGEERVEEGKTQPTTAKTYRKISA